MHKTEKYRQLIEELQTFRTIENDIADMVREFPAGHLINKYAFECMIRARLDAVRPESTDREIAVALFKLGCSGVVCAVAPGYDRYLLNA